MPTPINPEVCLAEYEVAQRRPALAEAFFYEYAHRLLEELQQWRDLAATGAVPQLTDPDHCDQCGEELFDKPGGGYWPCTECNRMRIIPVPGPAGTRIVPDPFHA